MAIIYGCVDWEDSGKIKFDGSAACLEANIVGCIEWSGEHAGMVKIIVVGAERDHCNDTYYGCVNWTTGKFQVTVPDDCCIDYCSVCTLCGSKTPEKVTVTFSGITDCSDCRWCSPGAYDIKDSGLAASLNGGTYVLGDVYEDEEGWCHWYLDAPEGESLASGTRDYYSHQIGQGATCANFSFSGANLVERIECYRRPDAVRVNININVFRGDKEPETGKCVETYDIPNIVTCAPGCSSVVEGGYATVREGEQP